jgi:hypothetical protein
MEFPTWRESHTIMDAIDFVHKLLSGDDPLSMLSTDTGATLNPRSFFNPDAASL